MPPALVVKSLRWDIIVVIVISGRAAVMFGSIKNASTSSRPRVITNGVDDDDDDGTTVVVVILYYADKRSRSPL